MHELSLAVALLETAESAVPAGSRVTSLRVHVGILSGVDPQALQSSWEVVAQGTCLHGARLELEEVAARLRCQTCANEFEPEVPWRLVCPRCGLPSAHLLQGRELRVEWLEVDDEPENS